MNNNDKMGGSEDDGNEAATTKKEAATEANEPTTNITDANTEGNEPECEDFDVIAKDDFNLDAKIAAESVIALDEGNTDRNRPPTLIASEGIPITLQSTGGLGNDASSNREGSTSRGVHGDVERQRLETMPMPRPPQEDSQPGAFHEDGRNARDVVLDVDDQWTTTQTDTISRPFEVTATAVDQDEENRKMQELVDKEVEKKVEQRIAEHDENAEVAEPVQGCVCSRRILVLLVLIVIVAVILAAFLSRSQASGAPGGDFGPTPAPTSSSYHGDLRELLSSISPDGGEALETPSTPQYNAFNWLADNQNLDTYADWQIIQRYALATFFFSTSGYAWSRSVRWLSSDHECNWYSDDDGIFCSNDEVSKLILNDVNLDGTIPVELTLLSHSLGALELSKNNLKGVIPSEVGLLTGLYVLSLQDNALSGVIPSEIGLLTALDWLNAYNNTLSGTIPSEVGLMTELELLDVSNNNLSGVIPVELGLRRRLNSLSLSGNSFSGTIPVWLGSLTRLDELLLANNNLVGTIPTEIGALTELGDLRLNNNALNGTIPSEIGSMTELEQLSLGNNNLTGTIITEIGVLSNLHVLSLRDNALRGAIPSEIGLLTELDEVFLEFNNFTGTIPSEIALLTNLDFLHLFNNALSGDFECPGFIRYCNVSCFDGRNNNVTCHSLQQR